jgi:hypothetical protein
LKGKSAATRIFTLDATVLPPTQSGAAARDVAA